MQSGVSGATSEGVGWRIVSDEFENGVVNCSISFNRIETLHQTWLVLRLSAIYNKSATSFERSESRLRGRDFIRHDTDTHVSRSNEQRSEIRRTIYK